MKEEKTDRQTKQLRNTEGTNEIFNKKQQQNGKMEDTREETKIEREEMGKENTHTHATDTHTNRKEVA